MRISGRDSRSGLLTSAPAADAMSFTTSVIWSLYGTAARTRSWARAMRLAAMSSMARVIFLVAWTVLMRRLRMRS